MSSAVNDESVKWPGLFFIVYLNEYTLKISLFSLLVFKFLKKQESTQGNKIEQNRTSQVGK